METYKLGQVLADEATALKNRRKALFGEEAAENFDKNRFGLALSGGGIRSATINLGFLRTLNLFKLLEKADYISTVSGGGYTGAYIQSTIKEKNGYDELFAEEKIEHLRRYGNYLIPGQSAFTKLWNTLMLAIGFLISWIMSLLGPAAAVVATYLIFKVVTSIPIFKNDDLLLDLNYPGNIVMDILNPALWALGSVMLVHLLLNVARIFDLGISKTFTKIETVIAVLLIAFLMVVGGVTYEMNTDWVGNQAWEMLLLAAGLLAAGFILNPNALSFHRYYRNQLADAYLAHTGNRFKNLLLKDVFSFGKNEDRSRYLAPYPLINTCLNLQNPGGKDKFKGAKASDYFLLSPMYCGSKLSKYIRTGDTPGYREMTLPAALTISAAAVNPGMGIYSSKMLSILMTLFNARLGFWVNNPDVKPSKLFGHLVWWPSYFFKELLSNIGTTNRKLNISDGGHIENLAVYELLRRQCRLIIAVDAGADPKSSFADLENLAIRARNELGIEIRFRPDQDPVDIIRPRPSSGYARKRFAIADLLKIWEEFNIYNEKGEPVTFKKTVKTGKKEEVKTIKLEALVNYFYHPSQPDLLKYRLDLKAERGVDLPEADYDRYYQQAKKIVDDKLLACAHLPAMERIKTGTLVYIKSSVTPPRKIFVPEYTSKGQKNLQFDTFKYKIYHPAFPHESTADQFFDPVQWESYFQLGQSIAADILGTPKPVSEFRRGDNDLDIDDLIKWFDKDQPLFRKEEKIEGVFDAPEKPVEMEEEALETYRPKPAGERTAPSPQDIKKQIEEEMEFRI
ncbi:MAG: hypothetical protein CMN32_01060 [Saprospirales bacterium]|nr:hypothetical protein [Saprospirales bacterium]